MNPTPLTISLKWGSFAAIALALALAVLAATSDQNGLAYRYYFRYVASLEGRLRPMFIYTPGRYIVIGQAGAAFAYAATNVLIDIPFWWMGLILIGFLPTLYIDNLRQTRVLKIEEQLDGFLVALANGLKATPSVGAAFAQVAAVVPDPMRSEIDLASKEMKVGSSLDQALLHMAARIGSKQIDSAFSAILIGRRVGGNLPRVLESTASSLREMRRLDGVIRTKTAEGKMQMWVIALMPFGLLVGLNFMWPGYFDPLTHSFTGYMIVGTVCVLWVSAILLARKVVAIDV